MQSVRSLSLSGLVAVVVLAGCASAPPAAPALASASTSVDSARASGATELAAVDMNTARSKLDRARAAAQAGRNKEAMALAEEADIDAQVARATSGSEKSRRAVDEVEAGLRTLREELNRATTQPVRTQ